MPHNAAFRDANPTVNATNSARLLFGNYIQTFELVRTSHQLVEIFDQLKFNLGLFQLVTNRHQLHLICTGKKAGRRRRHLRSKCTEMKEVLCMTHPKMQYTYVGIDSHKDTHTAVFIDCFFDKLGELQFSNHQPSFDVFLQQAQAFLIPGTSFMFGMEDCSSYGRLLMVYLRQNGRQVKHVNALLVAKERKNQTFTQKTDSIDAECCARVLLSKLNNLPDSNPEDEYWTLRTLVSRRNLLVRHRVATKHYLHSLLTQQYPNYRTFFSDISGKSALAFFERYPSPSTLKNVTPEELAAFLEIPSSGKTSMTKAKQILDSLHDTEPATPYQYVHDSVVQSAVRQISFALMRLTCWRSVLRRF